VGGVSAVASPAPLDAGLAGAAAPARPPSASARAALGFVTFFALAAFAVLEYAQLLTHPPLARLVALVALATAGCGALRLALGSGVSGALARVLVLLLLLLASFAVLGVPVRLLLPWHWGSFERHLHHGLHGLESWLWPYRGSARWARLVALAPVPVGLVVAGALRFWPERKNPAEARVTPLLALAGLFLAGAANSSGAAPALRGLAPLLLMAAWLWLPRMAIAEAPRAARWLLACAALGLVAEPLLSSPTPWIAYRNDDAAAGAASFQWDQLYGPLSWSRSSATMFEVSDTRQLLLRVTSLDRFDGLRFLRSTQAPGEAALDLPGALKRGSTPKRLLRSSPAPGEAALVVPASAVQRGWIQHATITIAGLQSDLLVDGGGVTTGIHWLDKEPPRVHREADGTLVAQPAPKDGLVYEISSYAPTPTPAQMRAAPRRFPRAYMPYVQFELPGAGASGLKAPDLAAEASEPAAAAQLVGPAAPGEQPSSEPATARRIEASPYGPMFALARQLAEGQPSAYDVAEHIERYLLANYTYDEDVPAARYPLEAFLFSERRGYCQQFSGAMTLMLRMDGIPARVGEGFKPQVYDASDGTWRVRALDAHAWVEVFFDGVGWVTFDPTPAARGGGAAPVLATPVSKAALLGRAKAHPRRTARGSAVAGLAARGGARGSSPLATVALAVLALIAIALITLLVRGRLRLRRCLAGDARGAVAELGWALDRLGDGAPAMTLAQLEQRLHEERREDACAYLRSLRQLRYAGDAGVRPSARGRAALRRALAAGRGASTRLRLLVALPPGVARHGG
jgi:protein-glutamine gamma-glutamyltransferase